MIVCLLQCDSCQARGQIVFSGVSSCTSASTSPSSFRPLKFHTHRQQKMCRILPPPQQPNMSGSLSHHTLWMATPQSPVQQVCSDEEAHVPLPIMAAHRLHGRTDGWIDERTDGRVRGWIYGWMRSSLPRSRPSVATSVRSSGVEVLHSFHQ
uniref:Uncharacterized protein n=2 Tax=Physcomitrium patens TaxID=3218 RepID=A0A2K1KEP3_PHYPA|nr:uncharacterized protein LOC112283426 [Physcomitrium patens]PNR52242.1 hypothetical protein PHYPA_008616 [Physcomitrium patens]|eukprot:XP_024377834.1 uncharacterized protein LOC112283426 [Physcomitrella patens]